uniref:uncharacterized protein LOC122584259 n=1 Tax=Erigeron canadensis TaxID=72917 RepID=UPI001CB9B48F|nr:uncharacterized protein LOC122584259 [Erigeron canadensis]
MGTLSRSGKYCPVHKPWNKVKDAKKQALLELLKTKFDIPDDPVTGTWILQSFGRKMLSEKNKDNRQEKKMVQVTGKKSYAQVREDLKASLGRDPSRMEMFESCFSKGGTTKNAEASNAIAQMKQIKSNLPEGSNDKPGPDDVFSKVMGKDRNGDVVMYGLGVRASDVWGVLPSRSACHRENIQLKAQCEELTSKVVQLRAQAKMNESMDGSSVPPSASHCPVATNGPPRLRV